MARKKNAEPEEQPSLFPEVEKIIALLSAEATQDIVILAVPSHDRHNKKLNRVRMREWASQAMELFADLYRGATAYRTFAGIYKSDTGEYLHDRPILIESYATVEAIHDPDNLNDLIHFAKRMGKDLDQESVMLIFGLAMYYVTDYSGV